MPDDDVPDHGPAPEDWDPALERDPAFLRRLRQHDRSRLRRCLQDELQHHWRRMPFDADRMHELAPQLTWVLGDGYADQALDVLEGILCEFLDDERVGALAAALGLHPRIDPTHSVDQRFSDYAALIGREGSFAGRRRAEKGAQFLAEFLANMDLGTGDRGSLDVHLTGTPDAVEARFIMRNGKNDASWFLTVLSRHLPELDVVASADDRPSSLPDWVDRWEIPDDGPWWKAFVLRGDVSDSLSSIGKIDVEMRWVAAVRPLVTIQHQLDWVTSHAVLNGQRSCWIALSWRGEDGINIH
ncbi:hypothetical protein KM427_00340 [Nocardioides sp. LMS-CY]|uniref:hypothetical protein n=1 Tax=Nocardioides sp. (strain LMS-CY) TaxID=2840457 RepID=UPI001C005D1D|nr:hypothetical protein [Nocardioides sp. LMS-CY]QWF22237.1 hypothetical protein KM427_00340 [Nocardioides sp. LMS-CY]